MLNKAAIYTVHFSVYVMEGWAVCIVTYVMDIFFNIGPIYFYETVSQQLFVQVETLMSDHEQVKCEA